MVETETAHIYIENEIVHLIYKKMADVGLKEIEENLRVKTELQEGKPMLTLIDLREVWQYSDEARKVASSDRFQKITIGMSLLVGYSLPIKLIANFFMRINKPNCPTKLFKKEKNAIKWLNKIK